MSSSTSQESTLSEGARRSAQAAYVEDVPEEDVEDPDGLHTENTGMPRVLNVESLKTAQGFIDQVRAATLENSGLPEHCIERLRKPKCEPIDMKENEKLRQSIDCWIRLANSPNNTYDSMKECFSTVETFSSTELEKEVSGLTGIYPMRHDMCYNSCVGFVGPFAELTKCPECGEERYEKQVSDHGRHTKYTPRKQFLTNPLGPQIQAAWRSRESAEEMSYRQNATPQIIADFEATKEPPGKLTDWIHGSEYREAVQRNHINERSTCLLGSLDGAQLYRSKQSDCWVYIWILLDRSPDTCYKKKHILVGGIIPGPRKPKNLDSFLFPGFQHLSALMKEGLLIWDASTGKVFRSYPFLAYITADGPGMQFINGLVGHSGKQGCRLYCGMPGRNKPGSGLYYPVMTKPDPPYYAEASMHPDCSVRNMPPRPQDDAAKRYRENVAYVANSTSNSMHEKRRLETGIAKMTIVSGLPANCVFGIPNCFPADIMHLVALNIPDLLIALWRATLPCEPGDNKDTWDWAVFRKPAAWKAHGQSVGDTTQYLPGSFDRPPRNIQQKLTSGYKAIEFLTYLYGLAPALLYGVLPFKYWQHFCKLVRGVRLVYQREITSSQLREAHKLLVTFVEEHEQLYYQRKGTRIHFVRQSIHANAHTCPETYRIGPYGIVSQFPMERVLGDLGKDIRQHSNPYGNLAKIAETRCQMNAVKNMYPQFDHSKPALPSTAKDLGDGYALLRAAERRKGKPVTDDEAEALRRFVAAEQLTPSAEWLVKPSILRWARLRLPNGQTARARWKEATVRFGGHIRSARQVKASQGILYIDIVLNIFSTAQHQRKVRLR